MLWKPIFERQAGPQCIHQTSMLRFNPSVELEDKVFVGGLCIATWVFMAHTPDRHPKR